MIDMFGQKMSGYHTGVGLFGELLLPMEFVAGIFVC